MNQELEIIGEVRGDRTAAGRSTETRRNGRRSENQAPETTHKRLKEENEKIKGKWEEAVLRNAKSVLRERKLRLDKERLREELGRLNEENSDLRRKIREKNGHRRRRLRM